MASILANGLSSFSQTYIALDVYLDPAKLDKNGNRAPEDLQKITTFTIQPLIKTAVQDMLENADLPPKASTRMKRPRSFPRRRRLNCAAFVLANPDQIGETVSFDLLASGRIDGYFKGRVTMESAALDRNISPEQLVLADRLKEAGVLDLRFNWAFFTAPDASDTRPEAAGLGVAILGSAYMMVIVLALSLPIGVAASIYLEEFAPQNRWTDLIEVNIANLAAVPSIVFGILGLALFINFVGLPQSAPIVGALVLTLMTLPTIIIATRAALKAVPPSIRDAALGIGASKMQAIFHHVLPLAAPGMLTGAIIGLAQALGETAPLLLIGMVAFVREYPAAPPEGFV
jgi:phosphate transport system permease protein